MNLKFVEISPRRGGFPRVPTPALELPEWWEELSEELSEVLRRERAHQAQPLRFQEPAELGIPQSQPEFPRL
jgi:hypothetical protein